MHPYLAVHRPYPCTQCASGERKAFGAQPDTRSEGSDAREAEEDAGRQANLNDDKDD
jgi:hypothetical protein